MPGSNHKDLHDEAMDWEASKTLDREKSERRAWTVAILAGIMTVLSWLAIVLMMPLKTT